MIRTETEMLRNFRENLRYGFKEKKMSFVIDEWMKQYTAAAQDLFAMTPYFWRSSREIREKSEKLENVTTMADFLVKVYIKK